MEFEILQGLPHRTIVAKNGGVIFGITTTITHVLVQNFLIDAINESELGENQKKVEDFDNSYTYAVPDSIFSLEDEEEVLGYIKENIDDEFDKPKQL